MCPPIMCAHIHIYAHDDEVVACGVACDGGAAGDACVISASQGNRDACSTSGASSWGA